MLPPSRNGRIVAAAASNNATLINAGTTHLHRITGLNAAAAVRYIKVYAKATLPVPATDVPYITIALPASTAFSIEFGRAIIINGLGIAIVQGSADNDDTAVVANDILGLNVFYD